MASRQQDALGGIDVLVNNAGIGMRTVNRRFMTDPQRFWIVELTNSVTCSRPMSPVFPARPCGRSRDGCGRQGQDHQCLGQRGDDSAGGL
jgi:NAD(P)-dependent dehydrogenase (short-subunit alcohol dehydrogenase family)